MTNETCERARVVAAPARMAGVTKRSNTMNSMVRINTSSAAPVDTLLIAQRDPIFKGLEGGIGEGIIHVKCRIDCSQFHQLFGVVHGQHLQKRGVDQTEDCRDRANAKSKDQDGRNGKSRRPL